MAEKIKILVIDDDPDQFEYVKFILEAIASDSEIKGVGNGVEALNYLNEGNRPDVIFLDINMPVMNGWEFLEEYMKFPVTERAKVIAMLTVSENVEDIERSKKYGLQYINKPVTPELLKTVIEERK